MTDETNTGGESGARIRSLLALALVLAALAWFAAVNPTLAALFGRITMPLLAALVVAVAATGLGRMLRTVRGGGFSIEPRTRVISRDLLTGVPILGTVFFLCGLASTSRWLLLPVLAAAAVAGAWGWRREASTVAEQPAIPSRSFLLFLAIGAVAFLHAFAVAQLPAFSLDEVAYHLTVVKAWLIEGRVVELPLLSHSYFPFGVESAALPLLSLLGDDGALAAHFLNLLLAMATVAFAFHLVEERAGRAAAAMAATALMTTPAMLVTAGWAWNDWPLLGVVLVLLDAVDREEPRTRDVALAIAAGLLIKYTFVVPAAALLLVSLGITRASRPALLRAVIAGGIGGSVFFLRNLLLTGNPFAPLLGPLAPKVSAFRAADGVLATMRGYVFDPGIADESLGIALLLLVAAGMLMARRAEPRRLLLFLACIVATLALALMMPSSRILVPALACAALLGCVFASIGATPRMARALRVLLFTAALLQMSIAIFYFDTLSAFGVMSSQMSEERFLSRLAFYEESKWANKRLPDGSKTLVIGLNSLFWFEGAVRGGGNFDGPRMNAYLESGDVRALAGRLREEQFTHVAIFDRGLLTEDALHRERATKLSPAAIANLRGVVNEFATPVAEEGNRHLFKLRQSRAQPQNPDPR